MLWTPNRRWQCSSPQRPCATALATSLPFAVRRAAGESSFPQPRGFKSSQMYVLHVLVLFHAFVLLIFMNYFIFHVFVSFAIV